MEFKILIVDDEEAIRELIKRNLIKHDYIAETASSSKETLIKTESFKPDLILLDIRLGEDNGIDLLRLIKDKYPDILVIMITAYPKIDLAVTSMKIGAYDFIEKPFRQEHLLLTIEKALDTLKLKKEIEELRAMYINSEGQTQIIGKSSEMQEALSIAGKFAETDITMLIEGESGSGKEVVAKYIHYRSKRISKPFVAVNCSAVAETLFESELFGYVGGAFTGAMKCGKMGYVEQAESGTLFLDEIGEMPLSAQVKLLRLLENKEYYRVGDPTLRKADIRIIAASNRKMNEAIKSGAFRPDLFYRLSTARIILPALRERKSDIIPLAKYFTDQANAHFGKRVEAFTARAEQMLKLYSWKGNVRQLKNVIERVVLLANNSIIDTEDLALAGIESKDNAFHIMVKLNMSNRNGNVLRAATNQIIKKTLDITRDNKTLAAKYLGIPRGTLRHHLIRQN